ncbi:hypothetical protein HQ586_00645 [Candidatus Bathyarchaeota archaeon]|nr:hypothetical protein [Candidatus Bathyarchaeota archaeon]
MNLDWLGGFTDGEGTFVVYPSSCKTTLIGWAFHAFIGISQVDSEESRVIFNEVKEIFGGQCLFGRKRKNPNHSPVNEWRVYGISKCLEVAKRLLPHLKLKHNICLTFISMLEMMKRKEHLVKDGFLKIIKMRDNLNLKKQSSTHRHYDYFVKYFQENEIRTRQNYSERSRRGWITRRENILNANSKG